MSIKIPLASLSVIAALIASPALAKEKKVVKEKRCEIIISGGTITKNGDCDKTTMMQLDGAKSVHNMIVRLDDGTHGKTSWFDGGNGRLFSGQVSFGTGAGISINRFMMDEAWDTNDDAEYSTDEIKAGKAAELAKYDSNRDGSLSLDEYQDLWLAKQRNRMVDRFQALDEDGDARVTNEEFAARAIKINKVKIKVSTQVKKMKKRMEKKKN
ncbi:MAG: hypothetical protein JKX99_03315 [Robiginitomaculum sp.]|nr:hypothetical protein [Robiginitomaculum sp.]